MNKKVKIKYLILIECQRYNSLKEEKKYNYRRFTILFSGYISFIKLHNYYYSI